MLMTDMVIDQRYKILDEIGRGGMSIVYRATVERSGKIWAVKEVRKDGRNDYNVVKQNLIAEIQTLKEVKHAKLPEIADVIDNEDSFIIVMDYIEGVSLDKIFARRGAQPEEKVVDWAKQLCEVLGYLHSKNIIYRDMKPSNVMLKKNGEITIIDFGTAKKYEYDSGETTGLGTAGFAAPEQYGGHGRTDARTDIFCLGMTMYALLTGIDPQKNFIPDTSIRRVNPSFAPGLDHIIQKCTRKNPEERYQSCEEMSYDLEHYKDIDKGSRRKKIVKICSFVACFALSIVSGLCGFLFNSQAKALASDNYQELIDEANAMTPDDSGPDGEIYQQKIARFEEAIQIADKASESAAYLGILDTYLENNGFDPKFEQEEIDHMIKWSTNHKADLELNPEGYAEIAYRIGELYWFYYYSTNNPEEQEKRATEWFDIAIKFAGENFDKKKLKMAKIYSDIGSTHQQIRVLAQNQNDDDEAYKHLFNSITNLVSEAKNNSADISDSIHLDMLERARVILRKYGRDFKRVFDKIDEDKDISSLQGKNKIKGLCANIEDQMNELKDAVDGYDDDRPIHQKYDQMCADMEETKTFFDGLYPEKGKDAKSS